MKLSTGRYVLILLLAGLTTGALEPNKVHAPLDQEEYLGAEDWFQAGVALNGAEMYQEAKEAFARSIAIEPGNSLSWLNLGTAQALLGEYPEAVVTLKKSVQLDPKLAIGFANLAEVCFRTERFEEAVEAYSALLVLWPDSPNALYKLGLSHLHLEESGKAQAEYLSLKMVDPELADKLLQAINRGAVR